MTADDDSARRLVEAAHAAALAGMNALLVTPGPDLRYLTGYDAQPLERLTCLVLPAMPAGLSDAHGKSDRPGTTVDQDDSNARRSTAGPAVAAPRPTSVPEAVLIVPRLERPAAEAALATGIHIVDYPDGADPYPLVKQALGGQVTAVGLAEQMWASHVLALRAALPGTDQRLAGQVMGRLRARKTPDEVAALREAGAAIDAVHAAMGTWLHAGRTEAEVAAVAPGVPAHAVDAAAREPIARAGYGDAFLHRTGHGIGLDTHEEPYIVAGNPLPLAPGMAFSIEPGIYLAGRHGARIEDIVVVTDSGVERLNTTSTELTVLP